MYPDDELRRVAPTFQRILTRSATNSQSDTGVTNLDLETLQRWALSPERDLAEDKFQGDHAWPLVTLVTPSFNQAAYLEQGLDSVQAQGYPNLEHIVIDGGSTDESLAILDRHSDRLAYWESSPDEGQAQAINAGWRRASGNYLWWLNADDMLAPDSLFSSVGFLERNPEVDLVYGDVIRIDAGSRVIDRFDYRDFSFEDFVIEGHDISQAGALMRRTCLEKHGYLNEDLHYLMDKEYWLRIALSGGSIAHLGEPLALFRIHSQAKTQRGGETAAREHVAVTEWLLDHEDCPEEIQTRRGTVLAQGHQSAARSLVKAGAFRPSLWELGMTVRNDARALTRPGFWHNLLLAAAGLVFGEANLNRLRAWFRSQTMGGRI